ncbi:type VI secretion system-associated protein VasI [Photobacterium indicum]|uniref:type VI secretion system-associated protein VasI n=1 Tax=Photobacterium indicum TaxID=81447 RepID=UPI003D0A0551
MTISPSLIVWVVCAVVLLPFSADTTASSPCQSATFMTPNVLLDEAKNCTQIEGRLERLNCFDNALHTPVGHIEASALIAEVLAMPAAWERAVRGEKNRTVKSGFNLIYADPDNLTSSMWATAVAKGTYQSDPASVSIPLLSENGQAISRSILMLSCFDDISRVEIVLPEATRSARMAITIPGDHALTQTWISDDAGVVIRTGRGMPAVRAMKAMLSAPQLVIRSDLPAVDGLYFDTTDLRNTIKPLRKACSW